MSRCVSFARLSSSVDWEALRGGTGHALDPVSDERAVARTGSCDEDAVGRPQHAQRQSDCGRWRFCASAQRVLGDLEYAIANVDKLVAKQRGQVVIAAPLVLSSTLLSPILAGFRQLYPGIELVLNDSLPEQVLPQVRTGTADLGIGTFRRTEPDLQRVLLFREAMGAVFPASHPFARAAHVTWRDLATKPVLVLRRGSVFRDLAEGGFSAAGLTLDPAFEANYVGSLIGLAHAGLGVAIVPRYATALTDKNRIRWKRLEKPVVHREVLMVHRAGLSLSPAAQAFADFLVKQEIQERPTSRRRSTKTTT